MDADISFSVNHSLKMVVRLAEIVDSRRQQHDPTEAVAVLFTG
jgi:hypothetical protein